MLELFLTTLVILLFLLGFIYLFGTFKVINIFLYVCQLIFAIALLAKTLYKKHILMDDLISHVHKIPYNAIKNFKVRGSEFLETVSDDALSYSTIKDSYYSQECFESYFISSSECPITDIIIEDEKSDKYKDEGYLESKINDKIYLYYIREKKDGKLYKSTKDKMDINDLLFETYFNSSTTKRIKKVDEDRENNSFSNFKNFIYYGDLIILVVISQYIFYIFLEPYANRKFDADKIFNITYELVIFVFYIIRYAKFVKFKNFLFDNKDTYKDKAFLEIYDIEKIYYFPNKVFNLDSFPVSISLNILLIRIIYFILPQKWHYYFKEETNLVSYDEKNSYYCTIWKSTIVSGSILLYFLALEGGFFGYYDNLIYNWKTNPIKSIQLSKEEDYEFGRIKTNKGNYPFYKWRDKYLKIEKLKKFNYFNIYKNENGKICGKDDFGNDLYFPNEVECPINDIIIDYNNKNYEGYEEIKLDDDNSIYYTNKATSKKIIIDLVAKPDNFYLGLNLKKTNMLCEDLKDISKLIHKKCKNYKYYGINSYSVIDNWDYNSFLSGSPLESEIKINKILNLVSISYFGFDPPSIKERKKIKTLERNLLVFKIFYILQPICFILSSILVYSEYINFENRKCLQLIIIFFKIIMIIFEMYMYLSSLIVRIKDIHNFIFGIIYEDKDKKIDNEGFYKLIISSYIIILIALFSLLIKLIIYFFSEVLEKIIKERKKDNNLQNNNNERYARADNINLNTERLNINQQITNNNNNNINNCNNNNINKPNQEIDNSKNITVFNKKTKKNEEIDYPESKDINNKKEDKDESKIKERIEYPDPLNINNKKEMNAEKSKLQISESNIQHLCAICYVNQIQVVLGPCGHKCLCPECYKSKKDQLKKCPLCNKNIELFIEKVYET